MANEPAQRTIDDEKFGSTPEFFEYYARESLSEETLQRFGIVKGKIERLLGDDIDRTSLHVLDVGCGAGTQAQMWATDGYRVSAIDINGPLVELGRQRAAEAGLDIAFEVGSADQLPFADASFDVCLVPELLEHVRDWESCLNELERVTRPGGILYLSTTNYLCPRQEE